MFLGIGHGRSISCLPAKRTTSPANSFAAAWPVRHRFVDASSFDPRVSFACRYRWCFSVGGYPPRGCWSTGGYSRGGVGGRMGPSGEVSGGRPLCTSLACATERPCCGDIMFKSFGKRPKSISPAATCTEKRSSRCRAVYMRDLYNGARREGGQDTVVRGKRGKETKGEGGFQRNS